MSVHGGRRTAIGLGPNIQRSWTLHRFPQQRNLVSNGQGPPHPLEQSHFEARQPERGPDQLQNPDRDGERPEPGPVELARQRFEVMM